MPNPYIHNKAGRKSAEQCGCEDCLAALNEYWAREEEISSRGWAKMTAVISDYERTIREDERKKVLTELGML